MSRQNSIGELIRRARTSQGLSQARLAEKLNTASGRCTTTRQDVYRWETGRRLPVYWLPFLAEVLHLPRETLEAATVTPIPPGPTRPPDRPARSPWSSPSTVAVPLPGSLLPVPVRITGDSSLESFRGTIQGILSLENQLGGTQLADLSIRLFVSVQEQLGSSLFPPSFERELQVVAGELAEIAGWLAYDAEDHGTVRRMNHESLFYTRLSGDRTMELLTLQNESMHAGALGRPGEALSIARSVLEGPARLSPRLRTLFLTRKARALAQGGDRESLKLFGKIRQEFAEGLRDDDPTWAWWIDEREIAWHEAMAYKDLGEHDDAVVKFQESVEATAPTAVRSQYLHRAYLAQAQADLRSWSDLETSFRELAPLIPQVSSRRTTTLIRNAIQQLHRDRERIPRSVLDSAENLGVLLDSVP
jgi:transcriptional regulator with XRE-family HTH domain/tetratricopeptide (TPR) repeat protein